eukprot:484168-Amphidinium_carterae.1
MAQTQTGLDQLVSLLTNLGIDTSDMSLNEAQRLVSTARTGQLTLPASSYQVPQTTTETRPDHTAHVQVQDLDTIPLTMLQQPVMNMDEESTSTAGILAAAAAVATPLPTPPTIPLTTLSEGEQVQLLSSTAAPATAKAPPPSVFVPAHGNTLLCMRRRRRRAPEAIDTPTATAPNWAVRRTRDHADWTEADTANTAQRQRMNPDGDYYTRQQDQHDRPEWHQRDDDQSYYPYSSLHRQRNTATTQAEWQQHPLWRMCGLCLEFHGQEYWVWNRCCARCAIFLCTIHATEMVHPQYIREREGDRELENTFYCGETTQLFCPTCLADAMHNVGDQSDLRHEQRVSTRSLPAPNDPAWDGF